MPSFARKYTIGKGKIGQIAFFYTNIIIGAVGCGGERGWGGVARMVFERGCWGAADSISSNRILC